MAVQVNDSLRPLLQKLSEMHEWDERFMQEDQLWNPLISEMQTRWTFPAAVLYALTVITTTGNPV